MTDIRWFSAACFAICLLTSCATPSSPTGGPPDEEGPQIIRTEPKTGKTNFTGRAITLHFSEFIERSSITQAIVVEPDIGLNYELDWGRKSLEIVFDEAIPDSTTLILTIGTELQDTNGNGMETPQKVAVSTGAEIDKGKIFGRVVNARTGESDEGHRILLYRQPVDLSQKADYIASTDTGGTFQFSYLAEGAYKAFWVDDRNRNKVWEPKQERAQPFYREFVKLKKEQADTVGPVFMTPVDTTLPALQGVGLFSSRRMRLRFSENIQLTDSARFAVTDTTGNFYADAFPLYIEPSDRFVLFLQSEKPLEETSSYTLNAAGVTDEAGNPLEKIDQNFTGSAQKDTTEQRIVMRRSLSGYFPADPIEVVYAKPIDSEVIRDSLKVVAGDQLVKKWPDLEVDRNMLRIRPKKRWKEGIQYEFRIWDPIIKDYQKLQPEIWHASQMGSMAVSTRDSTMKNIHLRIENEESGLTMDTTFSGKIEIQNLPPLQYKVIAFQDEKSNGKWNFGQVQPYVEPEPYFIRTEVPVKPGMAGELLISFPQ